LVATPEETGEATVDGSGGNSPLGGGPEEITRSTGKRASTSSPAAGFWEITLPAGMVVEGAVVTLPTSRPAAMSAASAWARVSPAREGATTTEGPVETTRATADPGATEAPAAGFWLMTLPAGTVALLAVVTVPRVSPAPVIAVVAAA
jgi:hypothetical protein